MSPSAYIWSKMQKCRPVKDLFRKLVMVEGSGFRVQG